MQSNQMREHRPRPCASFPVSHAYTAYSCDQIFISIRPPSSAAALLSPAARFTGVKPNIYECNRIKCGNIDLVCAHLHRYRAHIQHTRVIKYSYPPAVVPPSSAAALLSPAARFIGVKPNIYECNRIKCRNIDLVCAHLSRCRTHIQHTRASCDQIFISISRCPAGVRVSAARLRVRFSFESGHALVPTLAPGTAHGSEGKELPHQPLPEAVRSCCHGGQ